MPIPRDSLSRANAGYVEAMYQRYLADPASVPGDWSLFFAGFEFASGSVASISIAQTAAAVPHAATVSPAAGVYGLVTAYREFGHLVARLDPLCEPEATHPLLDPAQFSLHSGDLDRAVEPRPFRGEFQGSLREFVVALRETYCGTLGAEYMHIDDQERRDWLQEAMERRRNQPQLTADERVRILERLMMADAFEQFLHVKYVGQKRFSLEGASSLVPMLDSLIETAAVMEVEQVVIGMPHRGRLNVLANILGKPLERVFGEFESAFAPEDMQDQGDVKYHLGFSSLRETRAGRSVRLTMNYNPSHLEFVNPVVLGSVRARQGLAGDLARTRCWPVLIHGEAAFAGEGIVPETLMLAQLPAYDVGGTVHIVVNNQVGFTTSPEEGRSTRYATDIARVVKAPVLHVNGDDPEACVHAIQLATAYRGAFHRDVFVDLVCYRRHGHNELDDPTFTQPVMYRAIAAHTPAAQTYAARLIREGVIDEQTVRAMEAEIAQRLGGAHRRARAPKSGGAEPALAGAWEGLAWAGEDWTGHTSVARATLEQILRDVTRIPESFEVHAKVAKLYADRIAMATEDRVDWGCGEVLALGTLLLEGYHVRMSGQDVGRGTFSHRHAILHEQQSGARHIPLQHLAPGQGRLEIINSMLSEAAALGYEYGFSTADPHTLAIWEAQFGDFANVAQVIIDQFLASSEAKWSRMSGLVLLLPHGYEGQGPEHSSARLERFLELCARGNMQVCNPTTPAQLFHVLRRQVHRPFRKPLVIMSPKSLLRNKLAVSPLSAFTSEGFRTVIDDRAAPEPSAVTTVLLTSGRFYYALLEARMAHPDSRAAIVRVEQLYPFPRLELAELFARYPNARDIRWVQEEPANMGAWRHLRHRIEGILPERGVLRVVARKAVPAPATGYYSLHVEEERDLVARAYETGPPGAAPGVAAPAGRRRASR